MARSEAKLFGETGIAKLGEISASGEAYTDYLKFKGRIFKQDTAVALEFYAQKPDVQFIATASQWAGANYKIKSESAAIRLTDAQGNHSDYYDFSQIDSNAPPHLWSINAETSGQIKEALGIAADKSLVGGVLAQTLNNLHIADTMAKLNIPPQEFTQFSRCFVGAVQTVIAGRFEIGGNKFNVTPDISVFQSLDNNKKLHYLTMVSDAAKVALLKVEKIAYEHERRANHKKNDLPTMGKSHGGATEQHSGRDVAANSDSGATERAVGIADDSQRRTEVLADVVRGGIGDETSAGVQANERVGANDLVQVRPDVGDVRNESDEHGTVNSGRAARTIRGEVAHVDDGESPALGTANAVTAQSADGGEVGGRGGVGVSGDSRETVHERESVPESVRREREMAHNAGLSRGRSSDEGAGADSRNATLDKQALLTATAQIKSLQQRFADSIELGDYDKSHKLAAELSAQTARAAELKAKIQAEQIAKADVDVLRAVTPKRKSVQNLLEGEVAATTKFEKLLETELGALSPYELRKNDTRIEETTTVPVINVDKRDVSNVIADMKSGALERGTFVNRDTGYSVVFARKGIEDSVAYSYRAIKRDIPVEARLSALYNMKQLVEHSVLLDSQVSEYDPETSKNKSPETLFMHRMYSVFTYNEELYLANLSVEEFFGKNKDSIYSDTQTRLYNLKDIKITPIGDSGFNPRGTSSDDGEPISVTNLSISQLRDIVKRFDKSFYENISAPGRTAREAEITEHARYSEAVTVFAETTNNRRADPNQLSLLAHEYGIETASKLQKAFEESRQDGYQDNQNKQRVIKRALYDILRDEPQVEKAFTILTGIQVPEVAEVIEAETPEAPDNADKLPEKQTRAAVPAALPSGRLLAEIAYAESPENKFWDNLAALRELKRIESITTQNRSPYDKLHTRDDSMYTLSRYSGWGGLPDVFDESKENWKNQRAPGLTTTISTSQCRMFRLGTTS
jgi:hypothetical protein